MLSPEQCSEFNTAPRKILRDGFISNIQTAITIHNNILDLGCGPADYIIELCKLIPYVNITAIDGSPEMLVIAQQAITDAGLEKRILLKNMLFEDVTGDYDTVISTNTLHHISNPDDFWSVVKKVGRGNVFVLDLLRPQSDQEVEEMISKYASFTNKNYETDFRNSLKAAFSLSEIRDQLFKNNLNHLTVETLGNKVVMIYGELLAS